jgi:hypothetical protein
MYEHHHDELDLTSNEWQTHESICFKPHSNGNIELAKWLIAKGCCNNRPEQLIKACEKGELSLAKLLVPVVGELPTDQMVKAFIRANWEIQQWLITVMTPDQIRQAIHFDRESLFIKACADNDLELAKFLYQLGIETQSPINIHVSNNQVFNEACRRGRLVLAKWLVSLEPEFDVHLDDDIAFVKACSWQQLETAKWLYGLGNVNVHGHGDEALMTSCKWGYRSIYQWLLTLDPAGYTPDLLTRAHQVTSSNRTVDGRPREPDTLEWLSKQIESKSMEPSL